MIRNASDVRKEMIFKKHTKYIEKIAEAIDNNVVRGNCEVIFDEVDWKKLNYDELNEYMKSIGYVIWKGNPPKSFYGETEYSICISWSL